MYTTRWVREIKFIFFYFIPKFLLGKNFRYTIVHMEPKRVPFPELFSLSSLAWQKNQQQQQQHREEEERARGCLRSSQRGVLFLLLLLLRLPSCLSCLPFFGPHQVKPSPPLPHPKSEISSSISSPIPPTWFCREGRGRVHMKLFSSQFPPPSPFPYSYELFLFSSSYPHPLTKFMQLFR